jgi:hypothetical protein
VAEKDGLPPRVPQACSANERRGLEGPKSGLEDNCSRRKRCHVVYVPIPGRGTEASRMMFLTTG